MLSDEEPKVFKQPRSAHFDRQNMGMHKIMHREMLMKWTSESFVLTYFYGANGDTNNVQCLQPIRGCIREVLPDGLPHKENEIVRIL
jgi:hypothetical protein